MRTTPLDIIDVLEYEVHSSWLAGLIGLEPLQTIASIYFAWKVRKKHARYIVSIARRARLMKTLKDA